MQQATGYAPTPYKPSSCHCPSIIHRPQTRIPTFNMFNMQNQQPIILTIIDVRGRKFDIPVERITESHNAFLGKVRVIQEESTVSKSRSCPYELT